jgi:hypothetical protein
MSVRVDGKVLEVRFATGASKNWDLPKPDDKARIRAVRDAAMQFAKDQGATLGQQNAVRKAIAKAGFFLKK